MNPFYGHRQPLELAHDRCPPGFESRHCWCQGWRTWHRVTFEPGAGWISRCTNCGAEKHGLGSRPEER